MDKDYLEIISRNILSDIKDKLEKNGVVLEEKQEKLTDEKMIEIIKSVVENDYKLIHENEWKKIEKDEQNEKLNFYVMKSLIQYYMAIYNNNLDLLHKLLDNDFDWNCNKYYEMNLFVLDKRISSNFSEEELFYILENNKELLRNFYYSLYYSLYRERNDEKINADELINKACNILKKDKDIVQLERKRLDSFFTVDLLNNLSEEEMLNLNDEQKGFLNYFEEDSYKKFALKMVKKYNYSKELIYWDDFEKYFTEEEILNFSDEDIEVYKCIFGYRLDVGNCDSIISTAIQKVKEIKKEKPDFNYRLNALAYSVLTKEQIMSLSEDAVDEINNRCFTYDRFKYRYDLKENYIKRGIKITKLKDGIKNMVKKKSRN